MATTAQEALIVFPQWLKSLNEDIIALADLLVNSELPEELRLWIAGAVGYVLKSVDLIPDGVEDLGYLDDAFILRVMARHAAQQLEDQQAPAILEKLPKEAEGLEEFLGTLYTRLDEFASGLCIAVVRGKSPSDIVQDPALAQQVRDEIGVFARAYVAPEFAPEERTLIKLRSFLNTKLP